MEHPNSYREGFCLNSYLTGKFFRSLNLSYTLPGKPQSVVANNFFNYALGTVFELLDKSILFDEICDNTSTSGAAGIPGNPQKNTEISGGETLVSAGFGYYVRRDLLLSLSISYDNNHALLFRP